MKRFKDIRKEVKFADWTTKEILETDDYWRFHTGTLNSIQQSLIRLLEGYAMDSCECENLFGCIKYIKDVPNSDESLVRVFQDNLSKFFEWELPSEHMNFSPLVKKEWREKLASITHVDNTARVQTVTKDQNTFSVSYTHLTLPTKA